MRMWVSISCLIFFSCGNDMDKERVVTTTPTTPDTNSQGVINVDTNLTIEQDTTSYSSYSPPAIKNPSGIYQFVLSYNEAKVLHTVAFYPGSFRLQEEYLSKGDSLVITGGTWAPSQGFIWLYKEQLVRGRYAWKGDTLQYFNPKSNQKFSMAKLTPASNNPLWREKSKEGAILYGIGTEPFWSVEVKKKDSVILSMASWNQPVMVKLSATNKTNDSTEYISTTDSLRITAYPYFCNDGMSDFTYPNKVTINYKGSILNGCGVIF